ncbi:hypothetical protein PGT21_033792 [Puccinia graminis f. sp. tritici]|nr:hypothetical protein PGT21_033792 [Puccinia graminis f. sp. tritici]
MYESMPSPPDHFQESQIQTAYQETQGSEYTPESQDAESQEFPESIRPLDGSEVYCKFDIDYSIWVNTLENPAKYTHVCPVKPPRQLRMSVTDMSFSQFKSRVL